MGPRLPASGGSTKFYALSKTDTLRKRVCAICIDFLKAAKMITI